MKPSSITFAFAFLASLFSQEQVNAGEGPEFPEFLPPLTLTVTQQSGGNVNFDFSGSAFVFIEGSTSISELPSNPGTPPTTAGAPGAGEITAPIAGLTLSRQFSMTSADLTGFVFDGATWKVRLGPDFDISNGNRLNGNGNVTTSMVPFSYFQAGTFSVDTGDFDIIYKVIALPVPIINDAGNGSPAPPPSVQPGAPAPPSPPAKPILVVNSGAINSADTGLGFSGANQGVIQNLVGAATGDLNDRIFNARSGGGAGTGNGVASNQTSSVSMSRYLAFTDAQNIDPRVAMGLREGREVEVVDTLAMQDAIPISGQFSMLGGMSLSSIPLVTKAIVAMPEGVTDGKNPVSKEVLYVPQPTKWELFSEADYGFYDQDRLTQSVAGFEVDSYSGTIGLEYDATQWLSLGLAWTHAWSDAELGSDLGGIDVEGNLASIYAIARKGRTWIDMFYTYGDFDNETNRNTFLGSQALGDTESQTHNAGVTLGHNYPIKQGLVAGTTIGLNYGEGEIDGYTERNGGAGNLTYAGNDFESLVGRLGASLTCTKEVGLLGKMTNQIRAGWAHEFSPESGAFSATLVDSPFALINGNSITSVGGYTATAQNAHPGTDWLELGLGTRFDLNAHWNFSLNYEGQYGRNNATAHYGQARVGYEW